MGRGVMAPGALGQATDVLQDPAESLALPLLQWGSFTTLRLASHI